MPSNGAYTALTQVEDMSAQLTAHEKVSGSDALSKETKGHAEDSSLDIPGSLISDDDISEDDCATLPRVAGRLPWGAFLVAAVELCERFAYYGLSGPFQNYMSNRHHDPNGLPGALGMTQPSATALSNFFQFWCYATPVLGAVVADQYLGKYLTIKLFSIVYMVGIFILFATSTPYSIEHGGALPGLVAAMVIIGFGTGGIKSNVAPLIAEQMRFDRPFVRVIRGERVIVDPEVTVQRIYMVFYMCINLGSLSAVSTTLLELHVGFWAAYLLPLAIFCVGFFVLVSGKENYVLKPPQGRALSNCFKALWIATRGGFDLDRARPSKQHEGKRYRITWDDKFVDELETALVACKVFLFFPVYWAAFSQMLNNFISQAGQMELHGLPNDILPNINPITIILLIPLFDRIIYPFLRTRLHLAFTPVRRITLGFFVASSAMAYAAWLQSRIYAAHPCLRPLSVCSDDTLDLETYFPDRIHVAWQAPAYALIALSEILASITSLELAYAKAPSNMKSFIMSLCLLTSAGGSALGILVAPLAQDPYLVWLYVGLAIAVGSAGGAFHWTFKNTKDVPRLVGRAAKVQVETRASSGWGRDV